MPSLGLSLSVLSLRPYLALNVFHFNSHSANMPITHRHIGRLLQNTLFHARVPALSGNTSQPPLHVKVCVCVCERKRGRERLRVGMKRRFRVRDCCMCVSVRLCSYHWSFRNSFPTGSFHFGLQSFHSHPSPLTYEFSSQRNKLKLLCRIFSCPSAKQKCVFLPSKQANDLIL